MLRILSALLIVVLPLAAESFTLPATMSSTRTASSSLRFSLEDALQSIPVDKLSNPDEVVALLKDGAESFVDIVKNAESPADVITQFPTEVQAVAAAAVGLPVVRTVTSFAKSLQQMAKNKANQGVEEERTYPESKQATYEMSDAVVPFEFGDAAFVRPLLKQTQLETRPLRLVYDANRDGYDAFKFHSKVDGQGAAVVLAKAGGQWFGGYNPRGWASLGAARSSVASFLFYKTLFGWKKLRASRTGSMACGRDLFDSGIYFGADSLVIPLKRPNERSVTSRLGQYFEERPDGKLTVLPRPAQDFRLEELKILVGVYAPGEDIPNSGGVLELGFY